ncbi:uncharacterized protein I303_108630 [Kwoniella dejecticola CBS 10117]|uniref:Thioredoxin domain-containing protein n=1 Tax=Kwoniella dejecticola CBS 10117 TaxID=1296121 RepID=A0A1A5ZWV2_9TREE|nr:uncharacterized protein I303_07045 [Kwoniella dejecticola CBS 10117]OBR82286.1 hypothetical protein I303_07045 [Kwoniella dejecticola CBS 10117]
MPLLANPFPHIMNSLNGPTAPPVSYLVFYSDVVNGQMWCPDCRDVEQVVKDTFDGQDKPKAIIYWVGPIAEWRTPKNKARVDWNVQSIPTILRIENGKETARLVEDEILDKKRLEAFLK